MEKEFKLGSKAVDRLPVLALRLFGSRSEAEDFAENLRKGDEAVNHRGGRRKERQIAVGEFEDAVLHADRQRLATDRTKIVALPRFVRVKADVAGTMAVGVVLPFFGKEFDRPGKSVAVIRLEGRAQGKEVVTGGEEVGFAAELPR